MITNQQFIWIPDATGEGRVALAGQLDLSTGETLVDVGIDNSAPISSVNGLYLFNPSTEAIEAEILSTGQKMKFPAKSENYFPVISRMPCSIKFVAAAPIAEFVSLILTNYALPEILGGVA